MGSRIRNVPDYPGITRPKSQIAGGNTPAETGLKHDGVSAMPVHSNRLGLKQVGSHVLPDGVSEMPVHSNRLGLNAKRSAVDPVAGIRKAPLYPGSLCHRPTDSVSDSKPSLSVFTSLGKSLDSLLQSVSSIASSGKGKVKYGKDENKERGNWSGKLDFLLSCIGFAVGLGNVWRFPYLCYRNGGGAFLIPYSMMLAATGLPLFYLELAFGQFASKGPTGVWEISPLFKGVGFSMLTLSAIVGVYYNMIIAYVVRYFFASMTSQVPWTSCNNTWNTEACAETYVNWSSSSELKPAYPAEEFWKNHILEMSEGIGDFGVVKWELVLCLMFSWIVVFFCIIKGVKSIGKVVYFTAVFPYVVLVILFIRGVTLPGAADGIRFYIIPDWQKLQSAQVWGDAAVQIFYSLGPGWGGLIVMSSYNRFHNNCYRDAVIVAVINCCTSVFAGFVIFSMIGFMAHQLHLPVHNVSDSGPGLAFVAYPAGISMMPLAPFWAILFFFMLFTLGLDSMFTGLETVITGLADQFTFCRTHKMYVTVLVCIVCFLLGLPQCTQAGIYWTHLMDTFSAGYTLMVVTFLEVIVIIHIYGLEKFCDDVENMVGIRPNIYWKATWCLITPLTIVFVLIFNIWQYSHIEYNGYIYPVWAETLGFLTVIAELLWIPVIACTVWWRHIGGQKAVHSYLKCPWTLHTLKTLTKPTELWRPALAEHRVYKTKDMYTQTEPSDVTQTEPSDVTRTDCNVVPPDKYVFENPGYDDTRSSLSMETTM